MTKLEDALRESPELANAVVVIAIGLMILIVLL
jgi:hypothetical protein